MLTKFYIYKLVLTKFDNYVLGHSKSKLILLQISFDKIKYFKILNQVATFSYVSSIPWHTPDENKVLPWL